MVSFSSSAITALALLTATANASYELIAGYEPRSQVTDHNAIDLDQEAMEEQLAIGTWESYIAALGIYTSGAFSKSVAEITLTTPLTQAVSKGDRVLGVNSAGSQVPGKAYDDYPAGTTNVMVQYATSDSQKNYVDCQVGANVNPNFNGCYAATGSITIDGNSYDYTYDPATNNVNKRTMSGFSTSAEDKMAKGCPGCPYVMYDKFQKYYGPYDFANEIVLAAFSGSNTNFNNFNNDFGQYDYVGKEQIIKKGTAYMVVWMYVIREMEDALDDCKEGCTIENCNDDPVHAWDEAVAFYTGSLEGTDGSGSGKLAHALADKRCANFKTCGELGDSTKGGSHVNIEIFKNFDIGLAKINKGECASAREQKEIIETLMLIPLIQGTLRYAWKTQYEEYSEKAEAEGVIFAASVLPAVHACDPNAAATIADNMKLGKRGADFAAVKGAFQSTLECLGIDAKQIGGLYDVATAGYMEGAEPMTGGKQYVSVSAAPLASMSGVVLVAASALVASLLTLA